MSDCESDIFIDYPENMSERSGTSTNIAPDLRSVHSGTSAKLRTGTKNSAKALQSADISTDLRSVHSGTSEKFNTSTNTKVFHPAKIGPDLSELSGKSEIGKGTMNLSMALQPSAGEFRSNAPSVRSNASSGRSKTPSVMSNASGLNVVRSGTPMSIFDEPLEEEDKTPALLPQFEVCSGNVKSNRLVQITDLEREEWEQKVTMAEMDRDRALQDKFALEKQIDVLHQELEVLSHAKDLMDVEGPKDKENHGCSSAKPARALLAQSEHRSDYRQELLDYKQQLQACKHDKLVVQIDLKSAEEQLAVQGARIDRLEHDLRQRASLIREQRAEIAELKHRVQADHNEGIIEQQRRQIKELIGKIGTIPTCGPACQHLLTENARIEQKLKSQMARSKQMQDLANKKQAEINMLTAKYQAEIAQLKEHVALSEKVISEQARSNFAGQTLDELKEKMKKGEKLLANALATLDSKNKEMAELEKELGLRESSNKKLEEKLAKTLDLMQSQDHEMVQTNMKVELLMIELNEWRTAQSRGPLIRNLHVLMIIDYFPRILVEKFSNDQFFLQFKKWFGRYCGPEAANDLLAVVSDIEAPPPETNKCIPRYPGFDAKLWVFVRTVSTSYNMVQHMDKRYLNIKVNGEHKTMFPNVYCSYKHQLVPTREEQGDQTKRIALPPLPRAEPLNDDW